MKVSAKREDVPQELFMTMLHDRVLLKRIDEPQKGLIVIPDVARKLSKKAEVVSVGPGKKIDGVLIESQVKPGDIVYVSDAIDMNYSDIIRREHGYVICQEADILCVVGR